MTTTAEAIDAAVLDILSGPKLVELVEKAIRAERQRTEIMRVPAGPGDAERSKITAKFIADDELRKTYEKIGEHVRCGARKAADS